MNDLIGSRMAGGNSAGGRQDNDSYPTPVAVTRALFTIWKPSHNLVWEPACGNGVMSKAITRHGYEVYSSDKNNTGFGASGVDFLWFDTPGCPATIITNPPFNLAEQFIRKAKALGIKELALVLKSTYWHAARRYPLWKFWTPSIIAPLLWRPDFLGLGAPTMEIMWCIWDQSGQETKYIPVPHPGPEK
jgi:hypothetical protein